ncbi:MAG: SDR family NAD(P)-dependent oxidoreductase [Pseudomonadota bacterium]
MTAGKACALVVGASGGLGSALVDALHSRRSPAEVVSLSRREHELDITDEVIVAAAAASLRSSGYRFDTVIDATGILDVDGARPEKAFKEINADTMARSFAVNAVGPALLFKHLVPLLALDCRSTFSSLSARIGSIGDNRLGGWVSYRASKAALNQIVRCAAIEAGRMNPNAILVALHPGTVETALTRRYARGRYTATPNTAANQLLDVIDGLTPQDSGGFFDFEGKPIEW